MKRVPKYRLHRASGQAAVVLSGVWHYLGAHGSPESRERYDRLVADWLAGGRGRRVEPQHSLTVSAVLRAYLDHAARVVGRSQLERIGTALGECRRLYGGTPAAGFGGRAYKAVRAAFVSRGYNRRHCNHLAGCVKKCWRWALSEELVPPGAAQSVLAVAGLRVGESDAPEPEPVLPVALADVEATLPHLPAVVADMVRVQLHAGLRPDEVCRLRSDEVEVVAEDLWVWRPVAHKNAWRGHARQAFLGPRAIAVLAPRVEAAGGGYLFRPDWRSGGKGRRRPGDHYLRSSYSHAVTRACKRAGVEPWCPLQLRHLAATRLVERYGWETARVYLGHRSIDTTRIYAEDEVARVAQAAREAG